MAKCEFRISISPQEAQQIVEKRLVEKSISAEVVSTDVYHLDGDAFMGITVFEKYYFRSSNRAALTVIFENIYGYTHVKAIATGSSQGLLFNFDWGAADNFANSVAEILKEYIID
jgi:hypothetical protein